MKKYSIEDYLLEITAEEAKTRGKYKMKYNKEAIEAQIDHMSELIKRVELTKERSKKTIEDCDKLIEDINEFIEELKNCNT